MMKKIWKTIILSLILVVFLPALPAAAQDDTQLELRLRKDFGYAAGADMQGVFSLRATGPEDLEKVVFYIDGEILAEDVEEPFSASLNTDGFAMGVHTFQAVGYTSGGGELTSRDIKGNFVTAAEGWKGAMRIAGPLFGLIIVVMLVTTVVPILVKGKKVDHLPLGAERRYGAAGGAVCPKCNRPFSLNFFGLNLGFRKLDRCPYCGKWSAQKRLNLPELRKAEQAELKMASPEKVFTEVSEEEKVKKEIEESRYTNL